MIATRDPRSVDSPDIKRAARELARLFAQARASMPHVAWQNDPPPPEPNPLGDSEGDDDEAIAPPVTSDE